MTNYFSSPLIIFLIAGCVFIIIAKLLKVEKFASLLLLFALILSLALYFTGYYKYIYTFIFDAPPIQPADPFVR
jgi:drug/metabolite transporter (DMT)-like permease